MRHLFPEQTMSRSVGIDDTSRPGADTAIEDGVLDELCFARSVAINIVPSIWVDIGEFIWCNADNAAIALMHIKKDKWQLSSQAVVAVPQPTSGSELWPRVSRKGMKVDVVEDIAGNSKGGLERVLSTWTSQKPMRHVPDC